MRTPKQLLQSIIVIPAVILAGGGLDFLRRPMGVPLVCLWGFWWLGTHISLKGSSLSSTASQRSAITNSWALLLLILAPPWEYTRFNGPILRDTPVSWLGLSLFAIGIALQLTALTVIGKTAAKQPDQLVTHGPYRIVRHPIYLGNMLCFIGIMFATSSFLTLLPTVWLSGTILRKIPPEEENLAKVFGESYIKYQQKTQRLIPGIY